MCGKRETQKYRKHFSLFKKKYDITNPQKVPNTSKKLLNLYFTI